jgi:hypothetical protein
MVPVKNNSMFFLPFIDAIVDILQLYELDVEIFKIGARRSALALSFACIARAESAFTRG